MPPTGDLISELRQEIALLKQRNEYFEEALNDVMSRLSDTRKIMFAEREARLKLVSRYGGMVGGMLMLGTALGFLFNKAFDFYMATKR